MMSLVKRQRAVLRALIATSDGDPREIGQSLFARAWSPAVRARTRIRSGDQVSGSQKARDQHSPWHEPTRGSEKKPGGQAGT
jgi:hypothetical protein